MFITIWAPPQNIYSWMNHVCTYVSEENERGNYAIKINSGKIHWSTRGRHVGVGVCERQEWNGLHLNEHEEHEEGI